MPNINAALLVAQLEQLGVFLKSKRDLALKYNDFFKEINSEFNFVEEPQNAKSNYWLQAIMCSDIKQRDSFLKYTNENGVMTRPVWKLMNELGMFKSAQTTCLDNARYLEERIVNIPSSVRL